MLRFDPSGAIDPDYGVTREQLEAIYPRMMALRQELIEPGPSQANSSSQTSTSPV